MILPLAVSYILGESVHSYFLIPFVISLLLGLSTISNKHFDAEISFREAVLLVTFAWITISIVGATPFYLSHYFPSFIDSFFEALSGFTATGSTVLSDIEALPQSILFWRSETHWLGGMGIIVLAIVVLPQIRGNKFLFESEAPVPPEGGKLFAKTKDIAKVYWKIYLALTLIEILFLLPVMNPLDAITHSFSSIAGGGFSTKNNSIAFFDSIYIEIILSIFMLAGATSFILHFQAFVHKRFVHWKNTTFRIFIWIVAFATLSVSLNLFFFYKSDISFLHALRVASFQVISLITTTGFATEDFKYWPQFSQIILVLIMFVGGMSASTSGSIKVSRLEVLYKDIKNKFYFMLNPKRVKHVTIESSPIKPIKIEKVYLFVLLYIFVFATAGLALTADGNPISTSFTAVAATLGNVGPGLELVGPFDNFAHFSVFAKLILSFCMLVGRLEIWTVILLLAQSFWSI